MKKKISILTMALMVSSMATSQAQETKISPNVDKSYYVVEEKSGLKSELNQTQLSGEVNHIIGSKKWAIKVRPTFSKRHYSSDITAIKEVNKRRKNKNAQLQQRLYPKNCMVQA